MITAREERAVHIAVSGGVKRGSTGWWVRSQSNPRVQYWCNTERCTCPDYKQRGGQCKHISAVRLTVDLQGRKAAEAAKAPRSEAERVAIRKQFAQDVEDIWGEEYEGN